MKKNFTVNIAGKIFHIDEDAFVLLTETIQQYEIFMGNTLLKDSIIEELKYIIACKLSKAPAQFEHKVITKTIVKNVFNDLGIQEENLSEKRHINKNLFRNQEVKIVGGICSGFASYFNITPLLFRILFIFFTFVFGLGILTYIGFWIFIPLANTPLKKLSAQGLAFTPENISQYIAKDNLQQKKSKNKMYFEQFKKLLITPTPTYKNANRSVFKVIYKFFAASIMIGLSVFFQCGMILFLLRQNSSDFFIQNITNSQQLSNLVLGFSHANTILIIALFAILFVSTLYLLLKGINMFSVKKLEFKFIHRMFTIFLPLWLIILFIFASYTYIQFLFVDKHQTVFSSVHTQRNIMHIDFSNEKHDYSQLSQKWALFDDTLYGVPDIFITVSETDTLQVVVLKKSYGSTLYFAEKNCNLIKYEPVVRNDSILLQPLFKIENNKWKGQNVKVIIQFPEGKKFSISDEIAFALRNNSNETLLKSKVHYIVSKDGIKSI